MEHLIKSFFWSIPVCLLLIGCGDTVTKIDYLETDTYITTQDRLNHSEDGALKVSKSSSHEERILVKLPTGKRDSKSNLEEALSDPVNIPLIPFLILVDVLQDLLNCRSQTLSADKLLEAKLEFTVLASEETSLADKINLNLVSKPWWQSVNWERAHPFSSQGKWKTSGGDTDSSFTTVAATHTGTTLSFDVTTYVKSLLSQTGTAHYGLLLQASSETLGNVNLVSTQTPITTSRPRLVSTYQCTSTSSSSLYLPEALERVFSPPATVPYTYYLGARD